MRRRLQGLRREIHFEPSVERGGTDEMSGVQKAGAKSLFRLQHAAQAQAAVHLGREEVGLSGL